MRKTVLFLVAVALTPVFSRGQEPVILRTSVTPEEAWLGQRVMLRIDVLGENGWAQISKMGMIDVPGAYVIQTESQGTRLQETISGIPYSGQRYALSLFPQRGGSIEVPALPIEVTTKSWGLNAQKTVQQAIAPGMSFTCKVPPGAEGIRGLISTKRLTASQTWEPETVFINVGDAIKRTIRLQAEDVSGMAFASMRHPQTAGLGIYPGEPTVDDAFARGSLTGKRTETVTYIFERPGEIDIPGAELVWWDIEAERLERTELPGLSLQVAGSPTTESGAVTSVGREQNPLLPWMLLAAVAGAAALAWRFRGSVIARWARWQDARSEAEAAYFRRVMRCVRSQDPKATLRETMRWLDRVNTGQRAARLDLFLRQYGDARTQEAALHLARSLASGGAIRDGSALSSGLAAARARWRRARRAKRGASALLPELNLPA